MTPHEFKSRLASLVAANRNREAVIFVREQLPDVGRRMTAEDRMLVADWMEGVEMALDVGAFEKDASETTPV